MRLKCSSCSSPDDESDLVVAVPFAGVVSVFVVGVGAEAGRAGFCLSFLPLLPKRFFREFLPRCLRCLRRLRLWEVDSFAEDIS